MKLADWLSSNEVSTEFAKRIGVSRQSLWRYKNGRQPDWDVLERIAAETGGAVMPNDFLLPEIAPPPEDAIPKEPPGVRRSSVRREEPHEGIDGRHAPVELAQDGQV